MQDKMDTEHIFSGLVRNHNQISVLGCLGRVDSKKDVYLEKKATRKNIFNLKDYHFTFKMFL